VLAVVGAPRFAEDADELELDEGVEDPHAATTSASRGANAHARLDLMS
jgi:hypothetical protein